MSRLSVLDDKVAARATKAFGSMPAFYLLTLYGLLPLALPSAQDTLLYWSNCVQLISLPLLMVGQNVLGRAAEQRAAETHDAVLDELALLRALVAQQAEQPPAPATANPTTPKGSAMPDRPVDPHLDQAAQAAALTETHNGPTEPGEQRLLAAQFGAPNSAGVYGAPAPEGNPA
ncbi:hypothetical protein GCM10009760_18420 [Kitasatospora kazusensis]|uniref:DUF1003 domain-containing protein n=1 Tax=Kitasatospora kazusensis TaxID=407974 RepID=A0ABP5KZB7_9ACTN